MRCKTVTAIIALALFLPTLVHAASAVLTWDYAQNVNRPATGFIVQKCTQQDQACDMADMVTVDVVTLMVTDATLQKNVLYCYRVYAFDTTGRSDPSNTVCAGDFSLTNPMNVTIGIKQEVTITVK